MENEVGPDPRTEAAEALAGKFMEVIAGEVLPEGMSMFDGYIRPPEKENLERFLIEANQAGFYLHIAHKDDAMVRAILLPRPMAKRSRYWINILLFALTLLTTLTVGAMYEQVGLGELLRQPWLLWKGLPFSLSIMGILFIHEMGHYIASRLHGVEATLPYFIPFPTIIGTMGAVIRIKSPIPTRRALIDIGVAGPIAGLVAALPLTFIGLKLSSFVPKAGIEGALLLGDSLLFKLMSFLAIGNPPDGHDVILHPIAFAGWIGFFVTALNLIPVGQLDGGHIAYALMGRWHKPFAWVFWAVLLVAGIFWPGWWWWALLILIFGVKHPPTLVDTVALNKGRIVLGWICFLIFILTITPVPFSLAVPR
ncbi:MAG: site-2 protease family protein [candidate division WOR-3 bacterium]